MGLKNVLNAVFTQMCTEPKLYDPFFLFFYLVVCSFGYWTIQ